MNIAVIGAGVAGVATAHILQRKHNVTLIEARPRLGGHTHTVSLTSGPDTGLGVDTGFIVLNDRTYPLCLEFFNQLGVSLKKSDMSFGVWSKEEDFYYSSDVPNGLFAQRKRIFEKSYWNFWREVLRFNQQAKQDLQSGVEVSLTLANYIEQGGWSKRLRNDYLLPMGAAIWSASMQSIGDFPALSFLRFFENHGLLGRNETPQWMTVEGGSSTYMQRFSDLFGGRILLNSPVAQVVRDPKGVTVALNSGERLSFDRVVIAAHADQALTLLDAPSKREQELLGAWKYSDNAVVLHADTTQLPPVRRAWASWNYRKSGTAQDRQPVAVTYYMNRLQRFQAKRDYLVTLNPQTAIAEDKIIQRLNYKHPQYTTESLATQDQLKSLQGVGGIYYCGSYFGYGFHEDAVRSAVSVAKEFGMGL